ncbi:MAG: AMP phosphorylase [Candidatus Diapherotrites archaeon]|nr:AMP phosphorylase [Candidatus Diapherotrites archaeon]
MDGYIQNLKVKAFPIKTGKIVAILHEKDAKELGVMAGDRLELSNKKNGKKCVAVADITHHYIKEDEIGLFEEAIEGLGTKNGNLITAKATEPLKSLDFIKKKMMGEKLSHAEICEVVKDIAEERLSDIEATAFVSAVYMKGLDLDETISMAKALIADGNKIEFKKGIIVDKHSVGGTNGRASMIIVPIVASTGLLIPKTSSRSITSASGTADSMEVLANVSLPMEKIKSITEKVGGVIAWGGAVDLAPADDKIIKIEHPLSLDPEGQVIASVLAKKASVGSKFVVIDLPVGKYVKIKDKEIALRMAKKFVQVGKEIGMHVEAVITDGEEPSGLAFGPALEAKYALEVLEGKRFDNLAQKSCELAGILFEMVGKARPAKGYAMALEILESGRALKKMKEIIKAQGGKINSSDEIKFAPFKKELKSGTDGIIEEVNIKLVTKIARFAGAPANKSAGVMLHKLVGEKIKEGEELMTIYAENKEKLKVAEQFALKEIPFRFKRIILQTIK